MTISAGGCTLRNRVSCTHLTFPRLSRTDFLNFRIFAQNPGFSADSPLRSRNLLTFQRIHHPERMRAAVPRPASPESLRGQRPRPVGIQRLRHLSNNPRATRCCAAIRSPGPPLNGAPVPGNPALGDRILPSERCFHQIYVQMLHRCRVAPKPSFRHSFNSQAGFATGLGRGDPLPLRNPCCAATHGHHPTLMRMTASGAGATQPRCREPRDLHRIRVKPSPEPPPTYVSAVLRRVPPYPPPPLWYPETRRRVQFRCRRKFRGKPTMGKVS